MMTPDHADTMTTPMSAEPRKPSEPVAYRGWKGAPRTGGKVWEVIA